MGNLMMTAQIYHTNDSIWRTGLFYSKATWTLSFAFLPKKCNITKKVIWLKYAYKGTALIRRADDLVPEVKWHTKAEHLIWLLKGKI